MGAAEAEVRSPLVKWRYLPSRSPTVPTCSWQARNRTTVTGKLVRTIHGPKYRLFGGSGLAIDGDDLFVANVYGESVTELNVSTGALVRVVTGSA